MHLLLATRRGVNRRLLGNWNAPSRHKRVSACVIGSSSSRLRKAWWSAVLPLLSWRSTLAPCVTRKLITFTSPLMLAAITGVKLFVLERAFTSAPCSTKHLTTLRNPWWAATNKGAHVPNELYCSPRLSISALYLKSIFTQPRFPFSTATSNGVLSRTLCGNGAATDILAVMRPCVRASPELSRRCKRLLVSNTTVRSLMSMLWSTLSSLAAFPVAAALKTCLVSSWVRFLFRTRLFVSFKDAISEKVRYWLWIRVSD